MIASELLSKRIIPVHLQDTGRSALQVMSDLFVKDLPVVDSSYRFIGIISEKDLFDHPLDDAISTYELSLEKVQIHGEDHLFEVMGIMSQNDLTIVPVVDASGTLQGVITQEDLLHFYARSFSFQEPGSILVLEMGYRDYSLAQISNIIEQEGAKILSSFITSEKDTERVLVTIKINATELQHIQASLQRYGYELKATYAEKDYEDLLKQRYDLLMNYLGV